MQILELNVIEYASMKNRVFTFENGLNIIEGENESGKSTLLSFIKFMLYGFPKGKGSEAWEEKEKGYSWENGVAAGSMTVRTADGDFRIERSARDGVKGEKVSIISLADGAPVHKGEIPGDVFFDVSLSFFESTACVKQLGCSVLDGGEIGKKVQNLILSADEDLDSDKSISRIDGLRKSLRLIKGDGGSIFRLEGRRDELRSRLKTAKERSVQIMEYESSYLKAKSICDECRTRVEELSELNSAYEANQALIKLEFVRSTVARIEKIEGEIGEIRARECHEDFLPDDEYRRSLALAHKDYENAISDHASKHRLAEEARGRVPAASGNEALASGIEEKGGAAKLASVYGAARRKAKKNRSFGVVFLVLTLLTAALFALALCRSVLGIPLLSMIDIALLQNPITAYVLGGATAAMAAVAVILFATAGKQSALAASFCSEYSLEKGISEERFYTFLSDCVNRKNRRSQLLEELARAEKAEEMARSRVGENALEVWKLLEKTGVKTGDGEINDVVPRVIKASQELCQRLGELGRELEKYKVLYEDRRAEAEALDERALRARLTPEILEKLKNINITVLRRDLEFERSRLEAGENKKNRLDRELVGMRASAENPLRHEAQLARVEERLDAELFLYDALGLAKECIREASENMKKNVTPKLRTSSCAYMDEFTAGKYSEIGVTGEFGITVNTGGATRSINSLSAGTKDAAYLALRLALVGVLYKKEMPPLLLDEVLSQIDDGRARRLLSMLESFCSEGNQSLLFTCHTREASMTGANVIRL